MTEFQLTDDTPENEKELLAVMRFVQNNPEGEPVYPSLVRMMELQEQCR